MTIAGVETGRLLEPALADPRPPFHLELLEGKDPNEICLVVRPDVFFRHLEAAIDGAHLMDRELEIQHLTRPRRRGDYAFTAGQLRDALEAG